MRRSTRLHKEQVGEHACCCMHECMDGGDPQRNGGLSSTRWATGRSDSEEQQHNTNMSETWCKRAARTSSVHAGSPSLGWRETRHDAPPLKHPVQQPRRHAANKVCWLKSGSPHSVTVPHIAATAARWTTWKPWCAAELEDGKCHRSSIGILCPLGRNGTKKASLNWSGGKKTPDSRARARTGESYRLLARGVRTSCYPARQRVRRAAGEHV